MEQMSSRCWAGVRPLAERMTTLAVRPADRIPWPGDAGPARGLGVHRPGVCANWRVHVARAPPGIHRGLAHHQWAGGLDHRPVLPGLHRVGAGPGHYHRPGGPPVLVPILVLSLLAAPFAAEAQPAGKVWRIRWLVFAPAPVPPGPLYEA